MGFYATKNMCLKSYEKQDPNRPSLMCSLSIQIVQFKTKNAKCFFTIT